MGRGDNRRTLKMKRRRNWRLKKIRTARKIAEAKKG